MGIFRISKFGAALAGFALLGGCVNGIDLSRITTPFQRQSDAIPSIDRPAPDQRGVITYETYQVIVANDDDNLATMAARIGLTATELADVNGLPLRYMPRAGEVLVLPQNVGGAVVASPSGWSAEIATSAIENATPRNRATEIGSPSEPIRHRVEAGETAYTIARQYNVSVTALATWNGLGSDLSVRPGQQLIIPVADTANIAPPAVAPAPPAAPAPEAPHQETPTPAPQAAPAPHADAPAAAAPAPTPPPATPAAPANNPGAPFIAPVDGQIARGYQPTGRNKNEGIDYSTAAGAPVRAAGNGTVALVSESLGGLGTIVLIRHSNDLMTVYGRVTDVTVTKGDTVRQGQTIGKVAPADSPIMHFEVRVGTESVDPSRYLR